MAKRVKTGDEKKLPDLNFKLKIFIPFSTSSNKKLSLDFVRYCGNADETRSQKLRDFLFDKLGIKEQKEFDKLFIEEISYIRDKIKEKIKKRNNYQGNMWFSSMIREEIEKQLKSEEKNEK